VAGLSIGRARVSYAELASGSDRWTVRRLGEADLTTPLFSGEPAQNAVADLQRALQTAVGPRLQRFLPLHVSIPDAALRVSFYELDEAPVGSAAQEAFVAFHMAREPGAGDSRHASQLLGRTQSGKQLLMGAALSQSWHRVILESLGRVQLRPWSLASRFFRQFDLQREHITGDSGALIALEPDTWSVAIWDSTGLLRHLRAQWRTSTGSCEEIAAEVERTILGYVHGANGRSVNGLWVCAGADAEELIHILNARTSQPCQIVGLPTWLESGTDVTADSLMRTAGALAAALQP
jgi:hypothetical protein